MHHAKRGFALGPDHQRAFMGRRDVTAGASAEHEAFAPRVTAHPLLVAGNPSPLTRIFIDSRVQPGSGSTDQ